MELTTSEQKTSYALGLDVATSFKRMPIQVDAEAFMAGVQDIFSDTAPKLSREEFMSLMTEFQKKMQEESQKAQQAVAQQNAAAGVQFLEENAKKDGVVTTASGLQYMVLEEGAGDEPGAEDTVSVHYEGTLIDGTVFDSSIKRGEPVSFPVNGVIPGWTEALQLMKPGSKFRLFVPSKLAYGERGAGQQIAPNSTLIFDVELIGITD